ncbi:hypothetical protein ACQP2U_13020 [Nocardia sp. CA-084685]|uniref:hypothetical protein n=1 Tax=Nocardia sp. CA-084685 TaxID=3239970 RepID=UPI003D9893AC
MATRRHNRGHHRRHRVSRELTLCDGALITGGRYLTSRELRTAAPRLLALRLVADA